MALKSCRINGKYLESLYNNYNDRRFVHPDPLEFLYRYEHVRDREIAGLIAATLAYGRVAQILSSVSTILDPMISPHDYVVNTPDKGIAKDFRGFKHRFSSGKEIAVLLMNVRQIVLRYGSLEECFRSHSRPEHETVQEALSGFAEELSKGMRETSTLISLPARGSACKRLHLYLRWMVRCDEVDPGGWESISRSKLIIPLDTHMFRIGTALELTSRKQANLAAALDITRAFRSISPEDPVKYDFSLTRFGIRSELCVDDFLTEYEFAKV